jgi:hypothetical protein
MFKARLIMTAAVMTLTVGGSLAQTEQPYAGLQSRSIKALSDRELTDLRAGRGMGASARSRTERVSWSNWRTRWR